MLLVERTSGECSVNAISGLNVVNKRLKALDETLIGGTGEKNIKFRVYMGGMD